MSQLPVFSYQYKAENLCSTSSPSNLFFLRLGDQRPYSDVCITELRVTGKSSRIGYKNVCVLILFLPSSVTVGELCNPSKLQFPHAKNESSLTSPIPSPPPATHSTFLMLLSPLHPTASRQRHGHLLRGPFRQPSRINPLKFHLGS